MPHTATLTTFAPQLHSLDPFDITVTLPIAYASGNASTRNRDQKWAIASAKAKARTLMGQAFRNASGGILRPKAPLQKARLEVVRFGSGLLDDDNLAFGFKTYRDALLPFVPISTKTRKDGKVVTVGRPWGLSIIQDDNPDVLVEVVYRQVRCKRIECRTEVRVTEV